MSYINHIRRIIDECVRRAIYESENISYKQDTTGLVNNRFTGHAKGLDDIRNPSTNDFNGEKLEDKTKHIFVSDNKYMIYKIKNFGNTDIKDTIQLFGNTVGYRRAYDTVEGAADRGGKSVFFRTISPESEKGKVIKSNFMTKTFWEFSFDGCEWFILKPNPVQSLKVSKF